MTRLASIRSSTGLRSNGPRNSASAPAYGDVLVPDDAETEERRDDRQLQPVASLDEVLDRGEHAVARTTLAGGHGRVGQAVVTDAGIAREQAPVDGGLTVLGRDQLGREVVITARMGPANVVEHQQRQRRADRTRLLFGQPQLLADRVVVVVAVDDHRVGPREVTQGLMTRLTDELEIGSLLRQLREAVLGDGSIATTRAPVSPAQPSRSRVTSPAYAPTSITDRAPAASRQGSRISALLTSEWPH